MRCNIIWTRMLERGGILLAGGVSQLTPLYASSHYQTTKSASNLKPLLVFFEQNSWGEACEHFFKNMECLLTTWKCKGDPDSSFTLSF